MGKSIEERKARLQALLAMSKEERKRFLEEEKAANAKKAPNANAGERKTGVGGWLERKSQVAGGKEIVSGRVLRAIERHTLPGETVRFCVKGDWEHTLVALDDRVLIVKAGMWAGTTFGTRVATIHFRDITGIEVNTGLLNCVIEVASPSYPAVGKKSVWLKGNTSGFNRDPETESNCVPIIRPNLKQAMPFLNELRQLISQAKSNESSTAGGATLGQQLKELAALRDAGALSDEEFAQAKARLLASD